MDIYIMTSLHVHDNEMVNVSTPNATGDLEEGMTPAEHFGIGVILVVTGVFGGVGNCLVAAMFILEKRFTSSVDMLLLNLAVADVGTCGLCFPFVAASSFAQTWLFGEAGCVAYGYLSFMFGNTAICTLTAISLQRYFVICRRWSNQRGASTLILVLVGTWLQAFMWSSLPLLLPRPYEPEPFMTSCSVSWASREQNTRVFIFCLVVWVILHFMTLTFCYVSIYVTSRRELLSTSSRGAQDVLVSKICFALVAAFVVCWSPYAAFSLWYPNASVRVPPVFTAVPVILAKVSSCVNPLLYILVSERFRRRYLQILTCRQVGIFTPSSDTQPTTSPTSLV